uniref:Uncharacterized protein n=1 Tax=Arundo donax TaxID=35708 RepID=A0A0A8YC74_ARUDO
MISYSCVLGRGPLLSICLILHACETETTACEDMLVKYVQNFIFSLTFGNCTCAF